MSAVKAKRRPLPDLEAAAKNYDAFVEVIGREETGKGIRALFELASLDKAFQELVKIADRFEVPLWVMMLPDMPSGQLAKENLQGLARHVQGYFEPPGHASSLAAGDRKVLEDHVEAQRGHIFEAQGIIESVAAGLGTDVKRGQPGYPFALRAASNMLDGIAAELDPYNLRTLVENTEGAQS